MIDDMTTTRPQRTMSIKSYRKMKIKMLEEEFLITLTEEEKGKAKQLKQGLTNGPLVLLIIVGGNTNENCKTSMHRLHLLQSVWQH